MSRELTPDEQDELRMAIKPAPGRYKFDRTTYEQLGRSKRKRLEHPIPDDDSARPDVDGVYMTQELKTVVLPHADPAVAVPEEHVDPSEAYLYELCTKVNMIAARERLRKFNESQVTFDEPIGVL